MATFIKSAANESGWINDPKPEVCFIGRSNVGKSTLINAITNTKIARTSNTPGRTQLINFFDMGDYRLVDLPGYGYARVSHTKKMELSDMIIQYLNNRENLKLVFQICDCNVITPLDQEMAEFLSEIFGDRHYIILNKIDKHNKSFYHNNKHKILTYLDVDETNVIPISAIKKTNIGDVHRVIMKNIK